MRKLILSLLLLLGLISAFKNPQNKTITGVIVDARNGKPIAFASIAAKGFKTSVSADISGIFSITVDVKCTILVASAVGFQQKEISFGQNKSIMIQLEPKNEVLTEVVVTSLAVQRQKKDIGYATATVKSQQFFSGKIAGLQVQSGQGTLNYADDNTEGYSSISENEFHKVSDNPLSTFSIDVDAASYSNVRRFLNQKQLPPAGAVRVEEMINYFSYQYPQPKDGKPFSINTEFSDCPWNKDHKIVMIGLQGKNIPVEKLPSSNLVFLIDVSGSMRDENKLPLVKSSLKMLTNQLREEDKISIVVYAGNAGLVLPATSGSQKEKIKNAIDALESGGSTAGGAGIQLAYKIARENKMLKGNNRVILCTDGDFNVGASSNDEMSRLIEKERESGIYLTVLGYGMGNYKDDKMQELADKGNGNHAYIDGIAEAKKVLISEFGGTLFTIAKDVKLQVEFNPAKVSGYRLIGYENRILAKEDFNNDKKDAGELGSGHTVTALYEVIPVGFKSDFPAPVDPLKYQDNYDEEAFVGKFTDELLTVKFRYKEPDGNKSKLIVQAVKGKATIFNKASLNLRFATAVAGFGMLLRNSSFKGKSTYDSILNIASSALGDDTEGYRKEFLTLVETANELSGKMTKAGDSQ